jgi:hypothetical protein
MLHLVFSDDAPKYLIVDCTCSSQSTGYKTPYATVQQWTRRWMHTHVVQVKKLISRKTLFTSMHVELVLDQRWIRTCIQFKLEEKHYSLPCGACLTYIFNYGSKVGVLLQRRNPESKCPSKVRNDGLTRPNGKIGEVPFRETRKNQDFGGGGG